MRFQILNKSTLPLRFDPTKVCLEDEQGHQLEQKSACQKAMEAYVALLRAHSTRIADRDRSTDARKKINAIIEIPPTASNIKSVVRYVGQFPKTLTVSVLGLEAATGVLDVPIQVFDLTTP